MELDSQMDAYVRARAQIEAAKLKRWGIRNRFILFVRQGSAPHIKACLGVFDSLAEVVSTQKQHEIDITESILHGHRVISPKSFIVQKL